MNLLDSLRYLAALAEHRHFGRAAQACHITQPALSNAVRALEDHFGATIVLRGRQYEGLTPEGELALAHGHRLLHEAEALHQALASRAGAPVGRLVLGVVPSAEPVAARFANLLQALHPGLQPVLRSLSSPEIEAGLDGLAIDLGLGYTARPEVRARQLAVWPQYTERCWLLQARPDAGAADDGPLQIGPPIPWAEAAGQRLALLTPDMHFRALVDEAFARAGAVPRVALETNSVLALLMAVQPATGGGAALAAVLPGALVSVARSHPGLLARPLQAPLLHTPVGFLTTAAGRPTVALQAALAVAQRPDWRAIVEAHSGALGQADPGP
jgi:DNA-binding transcriptional LysR family regulator